MQQRRVPLPLATSPFHSAGKRQQPPPPLQQQQQQQQHRPVTPSKTQRIVVSNRHQSPIDAGERLFHEQQHRHQQEKQHPSSHSATGGTWYQFVLEQRLILQSEFLNRRLLTMRAEAEGELRVAQWVLENRRDSHKRREELNQLDQFKTQNGNAALKNSRTLDEEQQSQQQQQVPLDVMRQTLHKETAALRELHQGLMKSFADRERAMAEERAAWAREAAVMRIREAELEKEVMRLNKELKIAGMNAVIHRTAEVVTSTVNQHLQNLASQQQQQQRSSSQHELQMRQHAGTPPPSSYVRFANCNNISSPQVSNPQPSRSLLSATVMTPLSPNSVAEL